MTEKEYDLDIAKRYNVFVEKAFSEKAMVSLFAAINKKCGADHKFTYKVSTSRDGKVRLDIESENFADSNPIIAMAWLEFRIENFGGNFWYERNKRSYYGNLEEDFSKPCPNFGYTMSIHYGYKHIDFGTNGAQIGVASVSEKTNYEWSFKTERERRNED